MKKSTKSKSPKSAKAKRQPKPKAEAAKTATVADPNNPYRAGTAYHVLFSQGSEWIEKLALIAKTAALTGKSETKTGYNFNVLKAKSHRSNGGRSGLLEENGKVKFIALKKSPTG